MQRGQAQGEARRRQCSRLRAPRAAPGGGRPRQRALVRHHGARAYGVAGACLSRASHNRLQQLTRAPQPQLPRLITSFAAPAAPQSEVHTPAATSGPLTSPLLLPRPHLSHLLAPGAESFWEHGGMCSPAIVQHHAWACMPLDNMDEGLFAADNLFDPADLVFEPDSVRRGSLPEMMPRVVLPVASPGAMRHALPLRLFGDGSSAELRRLR